MPRFQLLLLAAAVTALASCVPPEPSNDIIEDYDPVLTEMGAVQEAGELVVGLEEGPAPFAAGGDGASPDGFTAALGAEVADSLGVEVRYVIAPRAELGALVDSEEVDVAFPLTPISEQALKEHRYSDPYWVGHQRILALAEGVETVGDLAGRPVCASLDEVTGVTLAELKVDAEVTTAPVPWECPGGVDALVASDIELIGMLAGDDVDAELTGEQVTTTGYGAMVAADDGSFATFIDAVFGEAEREGRWAGWYEAYVSSLTGVRPPEPPSMGLEEATALYPAGF